MSTVVAASVEVVAAVHEQRSAGRVMEEMGKGVLSLTKFVRSGAQEQWASARTLESEAEQTRTTSSQMLGLLQTHEELLMKIEAAAHEVLTGVEDNTEQADALSELVSGLLEESRTLRLHMANFKV